MKFLKTTLLLGCGANPGVAFAPSILIKRGDLIKTYLSTTNAVGAETGTEKKGVGDNYCIPLQDICMDDLPKVGGKTAPLGEMIQQLTPLGVAVPGGFGVSSMAYDGMFVRSWCGLCTLLLILTNSSLQQ